MTIHKVLLTGGTGTLGATVLDQLLAAGHKVNAVIRSAKKSQSFLEQKYSTYIATKSLEFTEIPDMTVPTVFNKPAQTADIIIHVATPLSTGDFEQTMIQPTWKISENILTAAAKSLSVKRVIISGTQGSTMDMPTGVFQDALISEKDWNPIKHEDGVLNIMNSYFYSKTNAEKKAWAWMEKEKPKFDLIVLLAPLIIGRSIQHGFIPDKTALGGVPIIYAAIFDVAEPGFIFPSFM